MSEDDDGQRELPDNVVRLFADVENDPEDEDSPLNTILFAGPTGIFIQQEGAMTTNEVDCIALSWGQTQTLFANLIGVLGNKFQLEAFDFGTKH
tara:strand:+ start:299 stop:580 length:282 start_codon:yes stop_codon:yes gene_type:complete